MASTEMIVTGLDELYRNLQEFPARIEKNIMAGALRAGCNVYKERAKELVPVEHGDLKKSIKVKIKSRRGRVISTVVAGDAKAYYAQFIEFGTGSFYAGTGSKSKRAPYVIKPIRREGALYFGGIIREKVIHPGIHPQPFMRPALDIGIDRSLTVVADYIRARIAREAARQ